MISRVRALSAFLITVVLIMPSSAGTYNAEVDVRNTVEKFAGALKKGDIAAIAKLVTPDFLAFENGEIRSWRPESDHSAMTDLPGFFPARGSKIERVEVSCDHAWAYGRAEVRDTGHDARMRRHDGWRLRNGRGLRHGLASATSAGACGFRPTRPEESIVGPLSGQRQNRFAK